jgi:hypothetical protein
MSERKARRVHHASDSQHGALRDTLNRVPIAVPDLDRQGGGGARDRRRQAIPINPTPRNEKN